MIDQLRRYRVQIDALACRRTRYPAPSVDQHQCAFYAKLAEIDRLLAEARSEEVGIGGRQVA